MVIDVLSTVSRARVYKVKIGETNLYGIQLWCVIGMIRIRKLSNFVFMHMNGV